MALRVAYAHNACALLFSLPRRMGFAVEGQSMNNNVTSGTQNASRMISVATAEAYASDLAALRLKHGIFSGEDRAIFSTSSDAVSYTVSKPRGVRARRHTKTGTQASAQRGPGRPKGAKNRPKQNREVVANT